MRCRKTGGFVGIAEVLLIENRMVLVAKVGSEKWGEGVRKMVERE
jgi:hypothetical protein